MLVPEDNGTDKKPLSKNAKTKTPARARRKAKESAKPSDEVTSTQDEDQVTDVQREAVKLKEMTRARRGRSAKLGVDAAADNGADGDVVLVLEANDEAPDIRMLSSQGELHAAEENQGTENDESRTMMQDISESVIPGSDIEVEIPVVEPQPQSLGTVESQPLSKPKSFSQIPAAEGGDVSVGDDRNDTIQETKADVPVSEVASDSNVVELGDSEEAVVSESDNEGERVEPLPQSEPKTSSESRAAEEHDVSVGETEKDTNGETKASMLLSEGANNIEVVMVGDDAEAAVPELHEGEIVEPQPHSEAKTLSESQEVEENDVAEPEHQSSFPDRTEDFLAKVASHPEELLQRCQSVTGRFRRIIREMYEQQSSAVFGPDALKFQFAPKRRSNTNIHLGPLTRLETGLAFDCEQLWEELEMRNEPFCRHVQRTVKAQKAAFDLGASASKNQNTIDEHQDTLDERENAGTNVENREESDDEGQSVGKQSLAGILKRDKVVQDSEGEDEETPSVGKQQNKTKERKAAKVRFLDDQMSDDDADSKELEPETKAGELEDGFFSLADMESFADEAEALALDGRLMASDDENGEGIEESDGDDDEDELVFRKNGSQKHEGRNVRYADFFAPPMNEKVKEETARALRRANLFDAGSGDEDSDDEVDAEEQTPLQRSRAAMRKTVDAMEDAAVAKKPWQLRGEILGDSRPKNSVLDANFEHDIAFHNRAFSAPQSAENIEDLVRQRIHDRLFDDVVRALPPEYEDAKHGKKDIPEVSQEKPSEGLGELYAREFAEQREQISKTAEAAGIVTKDEGPEETAEQKEVNRLFSRLCVKLDAMTSLHFTPSMPKVPEEMSVKPNVPALAAEEAIPEAVSDAALLAPNEVHNTKKEKALGELEKTKRDRRRSRRATKKRLAALNKERTTVQKHKEQADPVLAEKRRAERALERRGKKLKTEKKSEKSPAGKANKTGDFSKSNRFFSNLQNSIAADLAAAKTKSAEAAKMGSAAQYKL